VTEALNLDDGLRLSILQAEPGTPDHDALKLLAFTGPIGKPYHA
jgi:hypothetical protein